jgi:hypothetical protein
LGGVLAGGSDLDAAKVAIILIVVADGLGAPRLYPGAGRHAAARHGFKSLRVNEYELD